MRNIKKLGNNPMKKNSSSSKGVQVLTQHIGISAKNTRMEPNFSLYFSVIVRTRFQKYKYDSLIRFFILCSCSDLGLYIYNLDQEYHQPFVIKREDLYLC